MDKAELFQIVISALSDYRRLKILNLLRERILSVSEIQDLLMIKQAAVSKHLAILKKAGLVHSYKEGQKAYYYAADFEKTPHNFLEILRRIKTRGLFNDPEFQSKFEKYAKGKGEVPSRILSRTKLLEEELHHNSLDFRLWVNHFFKENDEIRAVSRLLRDLRPYFDDYIDPRRYQSQRKGMVLHCSNCKLRPWRAGDAESLIKHANNRKIWLNLRDRFPYPYKKSDAIRWIQNTCLVSPGTAFAIDVSGKAVGGIGIELKSDIERYSAEVGYWLGENFWGQGICTEALKAITNYAIRAYNLKRIYAVPFGKNLASIRVLEKAGYTKECVLRWSAFKDGCFADQVIYAYVAEV